MGWLQEFKIGDVFKGAWEDLKAVPGDVAKIFKPPKWVKEIDVGEFFSDVGEDLKIGTKKVFKGIGGLVQTAVGALTPTLIILALIAFGVLIFWQQIKKAAK